MFCDQRGTTLAVGAKFCPVCGEALGNVTVMPPESRLTRHLRLLGTFWLAGGALNLLAAGGAWLAGGALNLLAAGGAWLAGSIILPP